MFIDIIILNMRTINENHMMYGSSYMKHDRQNFLSFWTIFCPFTPLTTQKIKILKKSRKTPGDIIISHKRTINNNQMMYDSWDMKHERENVLSFWAIFCPSTPLTRVFQIALRDGGIPHPPLGGGGIESLLGEIFF